MNSPMADKLIIALDVAGKAEALQLVSLLTNRVSLFKIGLQLYTAGGPEIVRAVRDAGGRVFLDLKLHDIPNTVEHAVAAAAELGVEMLTLHASGGSAMLAAAVNGARDSDLLLLGVTVLTSSNGETLRETGVAGAVPEQVARLAQLALNAGIGGVVASPHELEILRDRFGTRLKIITPGVRPSWSASGDQKRFTTPRAALAAGADYLVIGRPVTAHADPCAVLEMIMAELEA